MSSLNAGVSETLECFAVVLNGFVNDCLKKVVLESGTKQPHFHQKCWIFPLGMVEEPKSSLLKLHFPTRDSYVFFHQEINFSKNTWLRPFSWNRFEHLMAKRMGRRKVTASQLGPPQRTTPRNKGLIAGLTKGKQWLLSPWEIEFSSILLEGKSSRTEYFLLGRP